MPLRQYADLHEIIGHVPIVPVVLDLPARVQGPYGHAADTKGLIRCWQSGCLAGVGPDHLPFKGVAIAAALLAD